MTAKPVDEPQLIVRDVILKDPSIVLNDPEVMRSLVATNDRQTGRNVVDLRGVAMDRLENRLDRLEDTHRSVIAAAYDNLAGTNQIHRAVLKILEPLSFEGLIKVVHAELPAIMRTDFARLILESQSVDVPTPLRGYEEIVLTVPLGYTGAYVNSQRNRHDRKVTLRQIRPDNYDIYGDAVDWVASEACLKLDFGPKTSPGMLIFGSEDPHQFVAAQGTDLLTFFTTAFERTVRKWLA